MLNLSVVILYFHPFATLLSYFCSFYFSVQEAGKLTSNITINKGAKSGDAKRMFCVMNLAVKQGDQITVQVEGENEAADAEVMKNFLEHNL